jgi:hypothetical protein
MFGLIAFVAACSSDKTIGIRHEPPSVTMVEPSDGSRFFAYESVIFRAQVETYDGTGLTELQHQWVSGSEVGCEWSPVPSDGYPSCPFIFDSPGTHTVTVTVQDPRLDTASATVSVEIGSNLEPTILIVSPENDSYFVPGDAVTLEARVEDPEDSPDTLTVLGTSSLDGALGIGTVPSSSGEWTASLTDLSAGEHLITLTVADSVGQTDQDTVTLHVNGVPTPPVVEISPNPSPSGLELVANIVEDAVDPEEDPISYSYQWFVDSAAYPGGTTPLIPAGITQRDQFWQIEVTPETPFGDGIAGTASITIDNSPPRTDAVTISPFAPATTDELVALATGWFDQDLDPEQYDYEWQHNGVVDLEEATDTFPDEKTTKGDELRVTVFPVDAFSLGESVSSSITTVMNSVPSMPSIIVTPELPEPTDNLLCTVDITSSDDDDDTITYLYRWLVDGVEAPGRTSSLLSFLHTSNGEIWQCEVTPFDGEDEGPSATDSVVVSDGTAPPPPEFDPLAAHRNKDMMDLTGSCEAECALDIYCEDTVGVIWHLTETCTTSGSFSATVTPLSRGETTTCYGTCTDGAGNISPDSLSVSSEVCDPEDIYENGSYGDAMEDPIDEWGSLPDDGATTINITGNVLEDDDDDWYIITASDDLAEDLLSGRDDYKFASSFAEGEGLYSFVIYRDDPLSVDSDSCMPDADGYTEYDWYNQDVGDAPDHAIPPDLQSCGASSLFLNDCRDDTADYFIQVFRNTAMPASCDNYRIQVTNGVW